MQNVHLGMLSLTIEEEYTSGVNLTASGVVSLGTARFIMSATFVVVVVEHNWLVNILKSFKWSVGRRDINRASRIEFSGVQTPFICLILVLFKLNTIRTKLRSSRLTYENSDFICLYFVFI